MKYIEVERNLENYTVRTIPDSLITVNDKGETVVDVDSPRYFYGKIPFSAITREGNYKLDSAGKRIPTTIDINIFLTQNLDNMGIFTDLDFTPKLPSATQIPNDFNPMVDGRIPGYPINFYYTGPITSTGYTLDNQLKAMSTLRVDSEGKPIYKINLNISKDKKNMFSGIISDDQQTINYKIGADKNNISTTGVLYVTYKDKFIKFENEYGEFNTGNKTLFVTTNGGWGPGNLSLSALIKEEEYLGIVFKPEISSDVFINRGVADIFERHAILSELKTTQDIDTMRGGYISG